MNDCHAYTTTPHERERKEMLFMAWGGYGGKKEEKNCFELLIN